MSEPTQIDAPARSGRRAAASAILACTALAASGPLGAVARVPVAGGLALALVVGLVTSSPVLTHLAAVALGTGILHELLGHLWPLPVILTLILYGGALGFSTRARASAGWLRRGRMDRGVWGLLGLFVAAEAIALIIWRYTTSADLGRFRPLIPDVPLWMIPLGLVGFAMINAAYEEMLWRGLMQHALEATTGSRYLAWLLQGVGFGLWHFHGFPSGWVGTGLATIFALMMGTLRLRSRGMLAPFLGHICADITIFTLVAIMFLR